MIRCARCRGLKDDSTSGPRSSADASPVTIVCGVRTGEAALGFKSIFSKAEKHYHY